MISYYTSITFLCWITLGVMSVLVSKNIRIGRDSKRLLYLTYALACDYPALNAKALVRQADLAMYEKKAVYYQTSGRERRGRRRNDSGA